MKSLAQRVMDLAEQQGLLDGKAIAELRKQVVQSKFIITPEAIAKVLVDHGHLTPFQARKLVSQALANEPDPVEQRVPEKPKPRKPIEDLTFADPADRPPTKPPEVVDLEPIEPETKPAARPAPKKPVSKPVEPTSGPPKSAAPNRRQDHPPPELKQPVEGSTADDFVDLEPVDPTPHARGNRWKTDSAAMSETIELTPIDLSEPSPLSSLPPDLAPIDDLFGPDPLAAPAGRSASNNPSLVGPLPSDVLVPLQPLAPVQRTARNVWDSPLILIGGGALGIILVLFALLFYALTRGSAA